MTSSSLDPGERRSDAVFPIPIVDLLFAPYAPCRIVSHQGPFVECEFET
jgi:hypothetical protein